jgi:hypothetical protein
MIASKSSKREFEHDRCALKRRLVPAAQRREMLIALVAISPRIGLSH